MASRQRSKSSRASGSPLALAFDGHGHDVVGVSLLAVSIVAAVGIYVDAAGPLGRGVAATLGALVGLGRYIAPVLMAFVAILLIRGPAEDAESTRSASRIRAWGGVLAILGILGLVHVGVESQGVSEGGLDAFSDAGGWVGAALGAPISGLAGPVGAVVVLVAVSALGLSLVSGRSVRSFAAPLGRGFAAAAARIADMLRGLFRVGDVGDVGDAESESVAAATSPGASKSESTPTAEQPARPKRKKPAEPTIVLPEVAAATTGEQLEIALEPTRGDSPWTLPPITLLSRSKSQQVDTELITRRGRELEAALAEHGVTTRLSGMVVGPTVTRYELELGVGVKVNQVVNLSKDIAYAMASPDVRIIAPIPGKQAIGVEVPNHRRQIVAVGDILCSPEAVKARSPLAVAIGRDIEGRSVIVDLATMPHLLIAGQTGAGKSSCINSIMTSILMQSTPDDVRLILVDPKRVELTQYNRVPHLLTQVVTNPKKAANALAWAVAEMERRYELLEDVGVRDIGGYNAAFDRGELVAKVGEEREFQRLPLILIVVDELADLMMVAARDVEESINRIAAKARAVGVHLVIATQRPSVNVITGVIKANIPARFAFSVASATDSKVILNQGGAERLIGKGDMLFMEPTSSAPDRIQGCWVDEKEVAKVVGAWRSQAPEVAYVDDVQEASNLAAVAVPGSAGDMSSDGDEDDELMWQAMELVVRSQLGSTSMLQRKLKVGFARAGRVMDLLEDRGVVGPSEGSKARDVLMTVEELDAQLAQR